MASRLALVSRAMAESCEEEEEEEEELLESGVLVVLFRLKVLLLLLELPTEGLGMGLRMLSTATPVS